MKKTYYRSYCDQCNEEVAEYAPDNALKCLAFCDEDGATMSKKVPWYAKPMPGSKGVLQWHHRWGIGCKCHKERNAAK